MSRVDPLPHQLEAVYDYLLKLPSVRFLLADDAGAGKTIMAGLLIRELKLRGIIERIAVVCPANLTFQWQRELSEKFDETFFVLKGSDIRNQFGANEWLERSQVITSLDLAKREDVLPGLQQVQWDLVIVDEAHRMSARDESHKSMRYRLGEILRDNSDHILLLTATPHKGDPQNFTLFLQLLDQDAYADVQSIHERALRPFLEETRTERTAEVQRIADHVELSLTELPQRADLEIGRASETVEQGIAGAEGRLAQAESRHDELHARGQSRRDELERQASVSLQDVARITTTLLLPHPEQDAPEVSNLRPNLQTEQTAMQTVMDYETARGCLVFDVHEQNLGYDVTSLNLQSGELASSKSKDWPPPTAASCSPPTNAASPKTAPNVTGST